MTKKMKDNKGYDNNINGEQQMKTNKNRQRQSTGFEKLSHTQDYQSIDKE